MSKIRHLNVEIDKLTKSIENRITGESFKTDVIKLNKEELFKLNAEEWLFDWKDEFSNEFSEIFKLITLKEPTIIQGLISLEIKSDHVFVNLIESASINKGRNKLHKGVPGNLMAFACKISIDFGFDGNVVFYAKTQLIEHYKDTLGALLLNNNRMIINNISALKLVKYYFLKEDDNARD